jgi:cell division protein FtsA
MQELSRYAVGLDIGTTTVRSVVGHVDGTSPAPTIIGTGVAASSGMRKGVVVNMVNVAQSIDKALDEAERMAGHQIQGVSVSINGSHIVGMGSQGVIAVNSQNHEIGPEDLLRAEEAATVVQLPANREILQVTPRSYQLDGQTNIKDPVGMTGVRLEVDAHVITALTPHVKNLQKACDMTHTAVNNIVLSGLAGAKAVLSEQQKENGVILIDFGGTTTNVAVYEEGDLLHAAVLPVGSVNITNDLAIGLKTDLDIADKVKLEHANATGHKGGAKEVTVTVDSKKHSFKAKDVDMIVEARLEEVFELVNKELSKISRASKLPGGAVLVGGGSNLKEIAEFAKESLQLPARIGLANGFSGVADKVNKDPGFATAIGLLLTDLEADEHGVGGGKNNDGMRAKQFLQGSTKRLGEMFRKFRT